MIVRRIAGITTKNRPAMIASGNQKSRAWRSWRRSVRAITSARENFTTPARGS